jgi:hypothetical protein
MSFICCPNFENLFKGKSVFYPDHNLGTRERLNGGLFRLAYTAPQASRGDGLPRRRGVTDDSKKKMKKRKEGRRK